MSKVNILRCRLKRPVVTADFDLIPAGTPVQVLQWADNSKALDLRPRLLNEELKVRVRVDAYMYLDDDTSHRDTELNVRPRNILKKYGFVNSGLIVETQANNLSFDTYEVSEV